MAEKNKKVSLSETTIKFKKAGLGKQTLNIGQVITDNTNPYNNLNQEEAYKSYQQNYTNYRIR